MQPSDSVKESGQVRGVPPETTVENPERELKGKEYAKRV
jgi:hypothetical protein